MNATPSTPIPPEARAKPPAKDASYVFIPRARCPECDSADLLTYHSADNGDGSTTRHTQCRHCGHKFKVVIE